MEIFYGIENFSEIQKCGTCVSVGTFDGLHIGHRLILQTLVQTAQAKGLKSLVLTFDPHPRKVLFPEKDLNLILSPEEKIEMFAATGVDYLVIHPFTKAFAAVSSSDFMDNLMVRQLGMRHLVSGFNNHFGCDRMGDVEVLKQYGRSFGFEVSRLDAAMLNGISASSTFVRNALLDGDVSAASAVLGYSYYISGTVVHGRHIGTKIGFPTANIKPDCADKLIPKNGVYAANVQVEGNLYQSVVNIGDNPTVSDSHQTTIEAYILDFHGDIYGKNIRVYLTSRIRDQKKFSDLEQLTEAIKNDIDEVKYA